MELKKRMENIHCHNETIRLTESLNYKLTKIVNTRD